METLKREISYFKIILGCILIFFAIIGFLTIIAGTHPSPLVGGIWYSIFLICGLLLVVFRFKRLSKKRKIKQEILSKAKMDQLVQHSSTIGAESVNNDFLVNNYNSTNLLSQSEIKKLNKWGKIRNKGKARFVFLNGVLLWGGLTGIIMSFIMTPIALLVFPLGGIFFGIITWNIAERHYIKFIQQGQIRNQNISNAADS